MSVGLPAPLTWLLGFLIVLVFFSPRLLRNVLRFSRYWHSRNIVKGPSSFVHALHTHKQQQIVRLGSNEFSVTDPELINTIYGNKDFLKSEQYAAFDVDGEPSIFSMRDPIEHQRRVKAVRNMFKTSEVARQTDIMTHSIERAMECVQDGRKESSTDVLALMRGYAVETISIFALGCRYLESEKLSALEVGTRFGMVLDDINQSACFGRSEAWLVRQFDYVKRKIDAFTRHAFENHKHDDATGSSTPLQVAYDSHKTFCLELTKGSVNQDVPYKLRLELLNLSEAALETEISDLLFAGTDSTATTLSTALWHIYANGDVLRALREDLEYVDDDQLASRPYLTAVLDEALRLAQPVPRRLPRIVGGTGIIYAEDKHNDDWHKIIPAGATVGISAYSLHRDPSFTNPETFDPSRWLIKDEAKVQRMKQCFIPFGRGHRACIGQELARSEIRLMLRYIVEHFDGISQGSCPEYTDNFNASITGSSVLINLVPRTGN